MTSRQVIYMVLMTTVFLGLNFFFSYQQDQKNREFLALKKQQMAQERQERAQQYGSFVASSTELGITNATYGEETQLEGIYFAPYFLTISPSGMPPETLVVEGQPLSLRTPTHVPGSPILYTKNKITSSPFPIQPEDATVQIVSFNSSENQIVYGKIVKGELEPLSGFVDKDALVLVKENHQWIPVSYYSVSEKRITPLAYLPAFSELIPSQSPSSYAGSENLYVLENDTLQLVFSTTGGALCEINLPFRGNASSQSVVNPIEIDRDLVESSPVNASFPLKPYHRSGSDELSKPKLGGYYPLLRRSIEGKNKHLLSPEFYACNLVSQTSALSELPYQVLEFSDEKIVFESKQPMRVVRKTFSLPKANTPYLFNLEIEIQGDSRGLFLTSGIPEVELISGASSPLVEFRQTRKGGADVEKTSMPKVGDTLFLSSIQPDWIMNSNGYLGQILDPINTDPSGFKLRAVAGNEVPTRLSLLDPKYSPYPASKYPGYQLLLPLSSYGGKATFRMYAGPFEETTLRTVDSQIKSETGISPDYRSARTFHGWFSFISRPFAKLLFAVMSFFHTLTHSWGLAIILLTVFLRVVLYPLNAWSYRSMKRMQLLSPEVKAIQERYKKDPKRSQMEIMNLYREHNVNPFMGCFPILIQLPFLIAMFDLLKSSFQLRGASFIPGWIENLTAPDVLFSWNIPIFFFGTSFHLLPVILGVVMFLQQRLLSPLPKDPSQLTDQQRQQKAMGTMMAVVFFVMFYSFPSGLNLYWLSSMILGMGQQWLTNKTIGNSLVLAGDPIKKTETKK